MGNIVTMDSMEDYTEAYPSEERIQWVEQELGYRLPQSYLDFMRKHNGGIPLKTCFPTKQATSWASDHVAISGIMGIGSEKPYSLCGDFGSQYLIEEWGYPPIGICICTCPSGGHDIIMLDYRQGSEPSVVHVDQEDNYKITLLANNFEEFIQGLESESKYDRSGEEYEQAKQVVRSGEFSPLLQQLCLSFEAQYHINPAPAIRRIGEAIVRKKKYFALHADQHSLLLYDIQFLLYTHGYPHTSKADFLTHYKDLIALDGGFTTGGYAPVFIENWMTSRMEHQEIVEEDGLRFSSEYRDQILHAIKA